MKTSSWKFIFPIAAMLIAQTAFADSAPFESPACAYSYGGNSAPTCSYLSNYITVDVGDWNKDYVLVSESSLKGVDDSLSYAIINEPRVSIGGYAPYYFLSKSYLAANGGFEKLFTYTNLGGEFGAFARMTPKNPQEFEMQVIPFIASTGDTDLNLDLSSQYLVGTKYAKVPIPNNPYRQLPLGSKDQNSEWNITYTPSTKFCEKTKCYAVLEQTSKQRIPGKGEGVQPSAEGTITIPIIPPQLPWYVRFWNFLKSLF